ncbi:Sodium/hydrogen exchanger family-domain-containing protein [Pisolithus microcarpus]|nr:Sodium/hydrogen exchanger family-domain-containing protein [Pisolithus microcarpus]
MISLLVKEKLYINEVVLGTGFGVLMGPYVADVFSPRSWGTEQNTITLEVMRIVLATGLFAVGYMWEHARGLLIMVVPTMAFGWVVVASILHGLFPMLDMISALCIASCLTPTDPVTCAAITRGKFAAKHVPVQIRRILSAESAANDGLAYPFLSISLYLTVETSTRVAIGKWFLVGWLYQVIFGTVLGAVLGLSFSKLMKLSHRKGLIDRESYIAQYLSLAIFTIGVASSLGADDLLAAFAAGSAISWDGHFNVQTEGDAFASVIDYVLNCGCFIYIGAWLPFSSYNSAELGITPWRLICFLIAILVLRRIPPLLLLYRFVPEISSWKEALFSGHFGPMGVSAVFVSALALTRLPTPENPPADQQQRLAAMIQPIVSFVVLGSIVIHGLSIPFFNLGRGMHSRTTSLSLTWTWTNRPTPDWVLWARRADPATATPSATNTVVADVERGTVAVSGNRSRGGSETILATTAREEVSAVETSPFHRPREDEVTGLDSRVEVCFSDIAPRPLKVSLIEFGIQVATEAETVQAEDLTTSPIGSQVKTVRFPSSQ